MSRKHTADQAVAQAKRDVEAAARKRAVAIVEACAEHNAGDEAARLILSDLSADEVAAMLRQRAIGESWAKATAKATGAH